MICPRCQTENVPQARFCISCGNALESSAASDLPTDMPPPSSSMAPVAAKPVTAVSADTQSVSSTDYENSAPVGSTPLAPSQQVAYAHPSLPLAQAAPSSPLARPNTALTQQRPAVRGFIIATVGNAIAVLAFFVLHYIEIPLLGGYSGSQVAGAISAAYSVASQACNYAQELGSASQCSIPPFDPAYILWAQLLFAGIAGVLAAVQWSRTKDSGTPTTGGATVVIFVTSGLAFLLLIGLVIVLQASANLLLGQSSLGVSVNVFSFLGVGFWAMALGTLAGAIGGIMQLVAPY
jgi:hypothetical protein